METNLRGCWLVSKAVVKRMASHGLKGSIINISSIAGSDGGLLPSAAAYTASKAGMIRFTKAMAIEWGTYGIRCNSIAPGLFESEITEELMRKSWMERNAQKLVPLK
eukprot:TRINITY_DN3294_c0_g1_i6.p1 TRINITY_DN3294_c0_g1~~TRINITY_DN3294_c0_g1_i6.p1  ORF type:complete len:107 (-),score=24.45 TRINITY_DN3294_c0_g1_i6:463-783(-)